MAELQQQYVFHHQELLPALRALQGAISGMFADMNRGFAAKSWLDFSNDLDRSVGRFLTRFDAIFTLNQDLLLELKYMVPNNVSLLSGNRWLGCALPGMTRAWPTDPGIRESSAESIWYPTGTDGFEVGRQSQPVYKLHGSSNWRYSHGQELMIIGGSKLKEINQSPVLSRYLTEFETALKRPGAKLMVIGYGFRDTHINEAIVRGVIRGLQVFVIAPEGADLAQRLKETSATHEHPGKTELEEMFEAGLIGASRRPLSESFGRDVAEFRKIMRFFDD